MTHSDTVHKVLSFLAHTVRRIAAKGTIHIIVQTLCIQLFTFFVLSSRHSFRIFVFLALRLSFCVPLELCISERTTSLKRERSEEEKRSGLFAVTLPFSESDGYLEDGFVVRQGHSASLHPQFP
jgi:hypothetical protein